MRLPIELSISCRLQDDAVWEDWLHSVMNLLMGFPVQMQLPLDATGAPDFMDAWYVVCTSHKAALLTFPKCRS